MVPAFQWVAEFRNHLLGFAMAVKCEGFLLALGVDRDIVEASNHRQLQVKDVHCMSITHRGNHPGHGW